MIREPAVAGQFYPRQPDQLNALLEDLFSAGRQPEPARAIISPHAGYIYSGAIAAETFAKVDVTSSCIVLGPNHRGFGHPGAVYAAGRWRTPVADIEIDSRLAEEVLAVCPLLDVDQDAHRYEHSLEVQIPFIQYCNPSAKIVPICLGSLPLEPLIETGRQLGHMLSQKPDPALIVASNDMTHFESSDKAAELDNLALRHVFDIDPEGLFNTVRRRGISMCGVIPVVVMLAAVREMGARKAELVRYGHSGQVSGECSEVVGYAGIIIR